MFIAHDSLGACAHCRENVVLIYQGIDGFRYCLGCERTGPDVTLVSEVKADDEFFIADDFTQVNNTPWELLEASRRG
jgi:hypothetical protein